MLSNRIVQLAAPPRWVPLPAICSAMLGLTGIIGAAFLIMGMLFVWLSLGDFRPIDEWRLARSTTSARALVTSVTATGATENDVEVYEYHFTFDTPDEQAITGRCYSTGQLCFAGDRVEVRYLPDKPFVAQLVGTRASILSRWVLLFVSIFPIVGAVFFTTATIRGLRQVNLLRCGEITSVRAISRQGTNTYVDGKPVIRYTYEFQGMDGQIYSGLSRALRREEIGDEAEEPVLYLPSDPRQSLLVDALPLRYTLDVDEAGQWVSYESVWPVVWCGLAWTGIIAHVIYGLLRVLGVF